MLKTLQREEWVAEIIKIRPLQMNEEFSVVSLICELSSLQPVYYVYQKKNKVLISFIALKRGTKIIHPFHFFYSALWVDESMSDTQYCECFNDFISHLLQTYTSITIRLPLQIIDLRPFLWNNFSVTNCYTYIKNLEELSYHAVTEKNIRKIDNIGYECKTEDLDEKSLKLNLKIFKDIKTYTANSIKKNENLMLGMYSFGYLKSFNCYKDGELIASNLIFLDTSAKIAYTVLLNKVSKSNKDDVHSLLHDFFFKELKAAGFEYVDLLGADMLGIAPFKSRFNTILKPHYLVNYNQKSVILQKSFKGLKHSVKRVLAKIS